MQTEGEEARDWRTRGPGAQPPPWGKMEGRLLNCWGCWGSGRVEAEDWPLAVPGEQLQHPRVLNELFKTWKFKQTRTHGSPNGLRFCKVTRETVRKHTKQTKKDSKLKAYFTCAKFSSLLQCFTGTGTALSLRNRHPLPREVYRGTELALSYPWACRLSSSSRTCTSPAH